MKRQTIGIGLALVFASPAWAVNKCTQNGRVVYQEAACAEAGELVGDEIARRQADSARKRSEDEATARRDAQEDSALQAHRQRVCKGAFYEVPTVGMTVDIWQNCTAFWNRYGSGRVNETETAAGIHRQHVFDGYPIKYLYTRNGVITAIQR